MEITTWTDNAGREIHDDCSQPLDDGCACSCSVCEDQIAECACPGGPQ